MPWHLVLHSYLSQKMTARLLEGDNAYFLMKRAIAIIGNHIPSTFQYSQGAHTVVMKQEQGR